MRIAMAISVMVALAAGAAPSRAEPAPPPGEAPGAPSRATGTLENGAPSLEVAVQRMLDAIENKDAAALRRLRVTEREYRDVILPGNVLPGQPPYVLTDQQFSYYWGSMNGRSLAHEQHLIDEFGGRHLRLVRIVPTEVVKYVGFNAHRRLRLQVAEGDDGKPFEIATGSVAEVGGSFKFVSFIRD